MMKIKELLMKHRGKEDVINNEREAWRIRIDGAVFTAYKIGTIYWNGRPSDEIQTVVIEIDKIAGPQFKSINKKILLGFDETGKGEVIGSLIVVGVRFPSVLHKEIEDIIGIADTKKKRSNKYWYELWRKIRMFEDKGLSYIIEEIKPSEIDRNNINELLDQAYYKIIKRFVLDEECSIVIDDYGIKEELDKLLNELDKQGIEVHKEHRADDKYLEAKLASIIAKITKINELEGISKIIGKDIGSGNISDPKTKECLPILKKIRRDLIR